MSFEKKENIKRGTITILVACHKLDPAIRQNATYMPIQVGKELHPELDLGFQKDNTGDNISSKNDSYCELTALYWAWKNLKDIDYIGLCHYRRYFDISKLNCSIQELLHSYDFIILKRKRLYTNIITEMSSLTSWEDAYIFIDILLKTFPNNHNLIYDYFYCSNKFTICNMFITSKHRFDEYCSFIFEVLHLFELSLRPSGYTRMKRVIGYFSEPLLGFWLLLNKCSYKELPMETPLIQKKPSLFRKIINETRIQLAYTFRYASLRKKSQKFFEDWVMVGLKQDGIM